MLFIVDALPNYCANCGEDLAPISLGPARFEVMAKASHRCDCGASWQLADREALIQAATASGGDLSRFIDATV